MPDHQPTTKDVLYSLLPVVDRRRGHIRTAMGNVIPFVVLRRVGVIACLLLGAEGTFGMTNWITIPVVVLTLIWAIDAVETATVRHNHAVADDPTGTPS